MTDLAIRLHTLPGPLPDDGRDVLIWATGEPNAQLGAYLGERDGRPDWVDAQGGDVPSVDAWAELPMRAVLNPAAAWPFQKAPTA